MKDKVRKSVEYSIKDGLCWGAMMGFVEPYIVPFALNIGASNFFIGVIRSIPVLISSFAQILSEYFVVHYKSCKKVVYYSVLIQAISIFLASLCILSDNSSIKYIFLAFIIIYSYSGATASAPWFTLMGEYLPPQSRGIFFGLRTQLIGLVYFLMSFLSAYTLKIYSGEKIMFLFIFISASLFRFGSLYYVGRMYESKALFHIPKKISYNLVSFFSFNIDEKIKKIYKAVFLLLFSTYIAAPYFSVYILKELKFDYVRYMFLVSFGQVLTWISAKYWGKFVDKNGSIETLRYAFLLIPFISLFWMLTKNFYLLLLIETFSGIIWGAFGIVYNMLVYEYIRPLERTKYNSYLLYVMSLSQFFGTLIGAIIYDRLSIKGISTFIIILAISTIGRFIAYFYFNRIYYSSSQYVGKVK
jgi:MFS family permease